VPWEAVGPSRRMAKQPGANITAVVREALDSVVTPSVRNAILDRALRAARRAQLPTEAQELDAFVHGPLHDTLLSSLGPELGSSVAVELERAVAAAKQAERPPPPKVKAETVRPQRSPTRSKLAATRASRSTMPSREFPAPEPEDSLPPGSAAVRDHQWADKQRRGIAPTLPATQRVIPVKGSVEPSAGARRKEAGSGAPVHPRSDDYPRGTAAVLGVIGTSSVQPTASARPAVFIATTDTALLRFFQAWLDLRASVEPAPNASSLLIRLTEVAGTRAVVVLDGKSPSIRALTLAALAEELPEEASVVLWGVPTHVHARMCSITSLAEKWLVCAGHATPDEVVAECARLIG